jgi:heme/copper-type cytochrome/quinol oxidase subunit 2
MLAIKRVDLKMLGLLLGLALIPAVRMLSAGPRLVEVIADKDNRFKVPGQKKPVITLKANEVIQLRITAHKGTDMDKDGAVHSFSVKEFKDQGWDLRLKEGVNEFTLVVPAAPGEHTVECTVKCGTGHEEMKMKLIITP